MTLRVIISRYRLERDVLHARIHGRIVGGSVDGYDDACMPDWIRHHRSPRVRQAWWGGFIATAEEYIDRHMP